MSLHCPNCPFPDICFCKMWVITYKVNHRKIYCLYFAKLPTLVKCIIESSSMFPNLIQFLLQCYFFVSTVKNQLIIFIGLVVNSTVFLTILKNCSVGAARLPISWHCIATQYFHPYLLRSTSVYPVSPAPPNPPPPPYVSRGWFGLQFQIFFGN